MNYPKIFKMEKETQDRLFSDPLFKDRENLEKLAAQFYYCIEDIDLYEKESYLYEDLSDKIKKFYDDNETDGKKKEFINKPPETVTSENNHLFWSKDSKSFEVNRAFSNKCL